MWYFGRGYLGMPDSVHDLPGRGFSGRVVLELEHVKYIGADCAVAEAFGGLECPLFPAAERFPF